MHRVFFRRCFFSSQELQTKSDAAITCSSHTDALISREIVGGLGHSAMDSPARLAPAQTEPAQPNPNVAGDDHHSDAQSAKVHRLETHQIDD